MLQHTHGRLPSAQPPLQCASAVSSSFQTNNGHRGFRYLVLTNCICFSFCTSFAGNVPGPELDVIPEARNNSIGSSTPPMISPGSPTHGPNVLMRNLSGSGLGRLHRVGSNALSDSSRHSLPQVCSSSCLSAVTPAHTLIMHKLQSGRGRNVLWPLTMQLHCLLVLAAQHGL